MTLQEQLDTMMKASRADELSHSSQLLLGELILKLENVKNKELPLYIDIMDKKPMGIDSWRGSYCELSITTETFGSYNTDEVEHKSEYGDSYKQKEIGCKNPTARQWIEVLKEAQGKTFIGYKGGDFTMSKNTPVWLAEYGESSFLINDKEIDEENYNNYKSIYFVDVSEEENKVYLKTKIED